MNGAHPLGCAEPCGKPATKPQILGRVEFGQEIVTIEKKGKPYAVILSPEQYEAFEKEARKRFGAIIRRIQSRNTMFSDAEIMKDGRRGRSRAPTEV